MAGGLGTYLIDETHHKPLPIVDLAGKPILCSSSRSSVTLVLMSTLPAVDSRVFVKDYVANCFLHVSVVTVHMHVDINMEVYHRSREL